MIDNLTTRHALPQDKAAMLAVIASVGLFPPEELGEMEQLLDSCFTHTPGENQRLRIAAHTHEVIGVAYYAPERMTHGTWNVYFIGVDPRWQGKGCGAALLTAIEQELSAEGQRLLLVETSGLPELAATRAFYDHCGYTREARIREFYKAGDDKIIFSKHLTAATPSASNSASARTAEGAHA